MVIDNRSGAQGGIGTAVGAKAAPDGYTILLAHSGALVINPHLYDNPGYDTLKDFAPVTLGTVTPFFIPGRASVRPGENHERAGATREAAPRAAHLCFHAPPVLN